MRKIFKTAVAATATTAMIATLFAGIGTAPVKAETGNALSGAKWTHFVEAWETTGYDKDILNTKWTDNASGFSANISMTGWQQNWLADVDDYGNPIPVPEDAYIWKDDKGNDTSWGDKPWQLQSYTKAYVAAGKDYTLNLTVDNKMTTASGTASDKSFTVIVNSGIKDDNDNTMLFKTYTVAANETETITETISISGDYQVGEVQILIAYGSYAYSRCATEDLAAGKLTKEKYDDIVKAGYVLAPNTNQADNLKGTLSFSVELNGEIAEKPTEKPTIDLGIPETTTGSSLGSNTNTNTNNNQAVQPNNTNNANKTTVKKPGKVKIKSAKNVKGKKIKITWKKVTGATKYQVKVGTTKKTTKKLTYTMKGLKKNKTYKVNVRAYKKGAGYGAWSKTKKVKVKK